MPSCDTQYISRFSNAVVMARIEVFEDPWPRSRKNFGLGEAAVVSTLPFTLTPNSNDLYSFTYTFRTSSSSYSLTFPQMTMVVSPTKPSFTQSGVTLSIYVFSSVLV